MIEVESSNIAAIDYAAENETLKIKFKSGRIYSYFNFPFELFTDFLYSESKGKFFYKHIKNKYDYKKETQEIEKKEKGYNIEEIKTRIDKLVNEGLKKYSDEDAEESVEQLRERKRKEVYNNMRPGVAKIIFKLLEAGREYTRQELAEEVMRKLKMKEYENLTDKYGKDWTHDKMIERVRRFVLEYSSTGDKNKCLNFYRRGKGKTEKIKMY